MASIQSNSYEGRYLKLTVVEESTSIPNNTSTLRWTLESLGGSSVYYSIWNCSVVINGTTVYNSGTTNWDTYQFPAKKGSVTGTITVAHKNDGSADPVGFALHGRVYYSGDDNKTGSINLSNIPRYPNITSFTVANRDETSVQVAFTVDSTCDYAWYSIDNGTNWSNLPTTNIIGNLTPNTSYNFKIKVRRTDSQLTKESSAVQKTTYDYPKANSLNNFTIGDSLRVNVYNPLNHTYTLDLISNANNEIFGTYTGNTNGDVIGFNDTTTVNNLYESIPSNKISTYYARVTYDSHIKDSTDIGIYQIRGDEVPTFTDFDYNDINTAVRNVTGDSKTIIKGLSLVQVIITSANKMIANNYANPNSYSAILDSINESSNYSTGLVTINMGRINASGTKRLTVTAYDSRTLSKDVSKDINVLDYNKPVINASVSRLNNFETETTLKVNGTFTSINVSNQEKNTIQTVEYRYKETNGSWSNWTQINTTISNNSYTCNDVILYLDNGKAFEFEIKTTDNFDNETVSASIDVGKSIFFISSNLKKCYINDKEVAIVEDTTKAGAFDDLATFNNVGANQDLNRSGLYSASVDDVWYNLLNIRHRNGEGDGTNYGMQLRTKLTSTDDELEFRHNNNSNWSNWFKIPYYESGSNSNGNYIKFSDGTMLCWNYEERTDVGITSAYGSAFITNYQITYPVAFVSTPVLNCTMFKWGTSASWGDTTDNNTPLTKGTLRGYDFYSRPVGTITRIGWFAIGKWK